MDIPSNALRDILFYGHSAYCVLLLVQHMGNVLDIPLILDNQPCSVGNM